MGAPPHSGPIGIFDSGVGGLSVLRHIRTLMPHEDLLYIADCGNAPYGDKPPDWIRSRSIELTGWLLGRGAKAIVIACNTATAAAAGALRSRHAVPVIGMEPAVKPAAAATKSGVVGVLATVGTLKSAQFAALLDRFAAGIEVVTQPCPGLVECVERGELDTPATQSLVTRYVEPLLARGADTIVLGCTHYPFVQPLIAQVAGPAVTLIETGPAVARQLERRLHDSAIAADRARHGENAFHASGNLERAAQVMRRLWDEAASVEALPASLANSA
jgi:glutamate racemase